MKEKGQPPRIEPLPLEDVDAEIRSRMGEAAHLNIFRTLAHHPDLMRRWLVFGNHVLGKSTLSPRERELVILRVGWLCRAPYEWGQHVLIGLREGLEAHEIDRITEGPEAEGWSELDKLLLLATDELHAETCISEATFLRLADRLSTQQILDLIFAVGQYPLVCMALNSLGVEPEPGLPGWPVR